MKHILQTNHIKRDGTRATWRCSECLRTWKNEPATACKGHPFKGIQSGSKTSGIPKATASLKRQAAKKPMRRAFGGLGGEIYNLAERFRGDPYSQREALTRYLKNRRKRGTMSQPNPDQEHSDVPLTKSELIDLIKEELAARETEDLELSLENLIEPDGRYHGDPNDLVDIVGRKEDFHSDPDAEAAVGGGGT